jgi:hypothetical protein
MNLKADSLIAKGNENGGMKFLTVSKGGKNHPGFDLLS